MGKLEVDYAYMALTMAPSCDVTDLDDNGPVKFEGITKTGMTLVAPVGHELKWDCRSRIPRNKTE